MNLNREYEKFKYVMESTCVCPCSPDVGCKSCDLRIGLIGDWEGEITDIYKLLSVAKSAKSLVCRNQFCKTGDKCLLCTALEELEK